MWIWVKFKEWIWDVHGQFKEFAHVGRTLDVRMSCGLYNIYRRMSAYLVRSWKWCVHHYRLRVAAQGRCSRSFKFTLESVLGAEEERWHKPSASSSKIEIPVCCQLPEAPELRDKYMIMIALLSLCTERILHFNIKYTHCRRTPLIFILSLFDPHSRTQELWYVSPYQLSAAVCDVTMTLFIYYALATSDALGS